MNKFTAEDFKVLLDNSQAPCLSLYLSCRLLDPSNVSPTAQLKKLIRDAEMLLNDQGYRSGIQGFLEPVSVMMEKPEIWRKFGQGLALFRAPGTFITYSLPFDVTPQVMLGKHFDLKPLLPVLAEPDHFYILCLSQNRIRLYRAEQQTIAAVLLPPEVPTDLKTALNYDQPENLLEFRPARSKSRGERPDAIYYGRGFVGDDEKGNLLHYFKLVDKGLRSVLREENALMVLAGVDYLLPIYKEANSYPALYEHGLKGNPDDCHPDVLRKRALELIKNNFRAGEGIWLARYAELAGTGLTSTSLAEISLSAEEGRVACLMIARGYSAPATAEYALAVGQIQPGEDLVNLAVINTLKNRGVVLVLEQEQMPGQENTLAIYRY